MINNYYLKKFAVETTAKHISTTQDEQKLKEIQRDQAVMKQRWDSVNNGLDSVAPTKYQLKNWNSDDAKSMVYRTSIMESMPNQMTTKQNKGTALGHTQIEPITYIDMWRYLNKRAQSSPAYAELRDNIIKAHSPALTDQQKLDYAKEQDALINEDPDNKRVLSDYLSTSKKQLPYIPYQQLVNNPNLASVMARVKYLMRRGAIPSKDDPDAQFYYWKNEYNANPKLNTEKLKATYDERRKSLIDLGDEHASSFNFNVNPSYQQNMGNYA